MESFNAIPIQLRRLFEPHAQENECSADSTAVDVSHESPLGCDGAPSSIAAKPAGGSGTEVQQIPLTQVCKEAAVRFVCPNDRCIIYPSAPLPSKEEIEERGEFWVSRAGQMSGATLELSMNWAYVLRHDETKRYVQERSQRLMEWIQEALTFTGYTSSTKRKACSFLLDLLELFFAIGSSLELLHIDWNLPDNAEHEATAGSAAVCSSWTNASPTAAKGPPSLVSVQDPTDDQKLFTAKLLATAESLIRYGSNREAYVTLTSVLHDTHVGLLGRLLTLPLFATVLTSFPSKQAAFLMSVNTTIHARILKERRFIEAAEQSLEDHQRRRMESDWTAGTTRSPPDTSSCTGSEPGHGAAAARSVSVLPLRPPFYLEWLMGSTLYIIKYFQLLGHSRYVKQDTDLHGVGPNSCTSLLSKVLIVLGLSFDMDWGGGVPAPGAVPSGNAGAPTLLQGLRWSPWGTSPEAIDPVAAGWELFLQKIATRCLYQAAEWFVQSAKRHGVLTPLEQVNVVAPLDDGGGDLELTPLAVGLAASISCFQHLSVHHAASPKLLPLVLDAQRFIQIGYANAYILLQCGTAVHPDSRRLQATNLVETAFMCEASCPRLLALRQERAANLGLGLFGWASTAPHCLPSVEDCFFETVFGLSIRPQRLLVAVLTGIAQRTDPLPKPLCTWILDLCTRWITRYPLDARLGVLEASLDDIRSSELTGQQVLGPLHVAVLHLFKQQVARLDASRRNATCGTSSVSAQDQERVSRCTKRLCRTLLQSDNLDKLETSGRDALWLEMLNVLKLILSSKSLYYLAELLREGDAVTKFSDTSNPSIHSFLRDLAHQVDIEQHVAASQASETNHHQCSTQRSPDLLRFVLSEVRALYDHPCKAPLVSSDNA